MTACESKVREFCDFPTWHSLVGNLIAQEGAAGELITDDDYYREYNDLHQLIRVRSKSSSGKIIEEYWYGPDGERIMTVNSITNTTIYTPFREWMMIVNSTGSYNYTYVYDGNTLVARINPDGTKWFYHDDHLGSTSLITDENGNIVEETFYNPFGQITSGGEREAYLLYTNQMKDAIGCYDYGARVYCPKWYHFTSGDPITANVFDPQGLNRFAYVQNNPYKYVDPDGKNPVVILGYYGIFIGGDVLYSAGAETYSQYKEGARSISEFDKGAIGNAAVSGGAEGAVEGTVFITSALVGLYTQNLDAGLEAGQALSDATSAYFLEHPIILKPFKEREDPKKSQNEELEDATTPEGPYTNVKKSRDLNEDSGNVDQTKQEGNNPVTSYAPTQGQSQSSSTSGSGVKGTSAARSSINQGYGAGSALANAGYGVRHGSSGGCEGCGSISTSGSRNKKGGRR